ncbi:metalloregulator ArsR/SmtB family transcription factor [Paraferrimonas sp. SM1919]|uniref:helix-turn-helix transcriptional regulator n=1 Tax=Paraferrimonas sp. SM1919 TaxID=2662263 RepID=UPI0013D63E65|nr:metalloregulator ArsR/SmtB family transcription factor [Paraferrimonas sp. SM1919]
MKSTDKILQTLKLEGPQTAQQLALSLGLTSMGARQHLQQLQTQGLIDTFDKKASRGRPQRFWQLTEQSQNEFGDNHSELTLQLIESVKTVFGNNGLEQLISHREKQTLANYQGQLASCSDLLAKVNKLAEIRTAEGYMATVEVTKTEIFLLENHCPICAAASACQSLCRSELEMFQALVAGLANVNRTEYILEGARRCGYQFVAI